MKPNRAVKWAVVMLTVFFAFFPAETSYAVSSAVRDDPVPVPHVKPPTPQKTPKPPVKPPVRVTPARVTPSYSVLENWRLTGSRPSVTLKNPFGKKTVMYFTVEDDRLILYDVPKSTQFTVPKGYFAYCARDDTERLSGKVFAVDATKWNIYTDMVQYEPRAVVLFRHAADLLISKEALYVNNGVDENRYDIEPAYIPEPNNKPDLENFSQTPEKVIAKYNLNDGQKKDLIRRHKEAAKKPTPDIRMDKYKEILRIYGMDYLAAYKIAHEEFRLGSNSSAIRWCDEAMKINPNYNPAAKLKELALQRM